MFFNYAVNYDSFVDVGVKFKFSIMDNGSCYKFI